jgi:twitching motility protein PilT
MFNDDAIEDLDKLVSELRLDARRTPSDDGVDDGVLFQWLKRVRELAGADLLLVAGAPATIRVRGAFVAASSGPLEATQILQAVAPLVPTRLFERHRAGESVDLAFSRPGLGRFRVNLHYERGRPAAAIRALPTTIPRLAHLNFTHDISVLSRLPRGLVLIGGPTGSGKTTTLAALIAEMNARDERHIIAIEDPIEYEHPHGTCVVEQIEIGVDSPDFATALRAAVRQAPDVIVLGEMRDPESMRIALAAAETGHLVFATVHTTDVASALGRITDAFPNERQNTVRQELAMALAAVLTQTLMRTPAGSLVPAAELLMVSYGARQHIRKNALQHLNQEITITRKAGSFTLEESLAALVRAQKLDRQAALMKAAHADELITLLGG